MAVAMVWPGNPASALTLPHWKGTGCATGQLTNAGLDTGPAHAVVVFGSAQLCPDTDPGSGSFAVATFSAAGASGLINTDALRPYAPGQSRPFGIEVRTSARFGVCLLASPTRRIACAEITTGPGDTVGFRLIEPTDPLVAGPVNDTIFPGRPGQHCNSCF
jgi:hypothetical protein